MNPVKLDKLEKGIENSSDGGALRQSEHASAERLDLRFRRVSVHIDGKDILNGVSGGCKAGEVLTVMGPTGAGKTTLLTSLAHRMSYRGSVQYGGEQWGSQMKKKVGFVEQEDIVLPALTVEQSLRFSAQLRLPGGLTDAQKMAKVGSVVNLLRLNKCRATKIGTVDDRGISGGERKRLCIAIELLADPSIIFFDEPTSGLDSAMALVVAKCMNTLAKQRGLTVVTTVHQPNSQIFAQFDQLLMLDDGNVFYSGRCDRAVAYFTALGHPCPADFNPPDFLMDLIVLNAMSSVQTAKLRSDFMPQLASSSSGSSSSSSSSAAKAEAEAEAEADVIVSGLLELGGETYPISYFSQIEILSRRQLVVVLDSFFDKETIALYLGLALLAGLLWVRLDYTEENIFPRTGLSLWFIGTWSFFPLFGAMPVFQDKTLLKKELRVGAYPLSAYYFARTLSTAPMEFVWPLMWCTVVYFLTNLNPSFAVFVAAYFAIMLNVFAMQAVGLAVSAGIPTKHQLTFCILLITYYFGYSGLFVPHDHLAPWLSWVRWGNLLMYSYQMLMQIVFSDDKTFTCRDPANGVSAIDKCLVDPSYRITSADIRDLFVIDLSIPVCIGFAIGTILVFRILAYVFLRRSVRRLGNSDAPGPAL